MCLFREKTGKKTLSNGVTIDSYEKVEGSGDSSKIYDETTETYIDNPNIEVAKSITAILNSTVFSVFAKLEANPQSGGYYKFNKQFLNPVPLPIKVLEQSPELINVLSNIVDEITDLQMAYLKSISAKKNIYRQILNKKWQILDNLCYKLYGLSKKEIELIVNEGRTIDRVDLLDIQEGA